MVLLKLAFSTHSYGRLKYAILLHNCCASLAPDCYGMWIENNSSKIVTLD